jgi:dihydroorotate dehydrogenase electron transfer subunit
VRNESRAIKTFTFKDKLCANAQPGQFLMLWIPQIDEIPLSIMNSQNGNVSVTVKAIGTATRTLHGMKEGDIIGVRGPFGNFFTKNIDNVLMIGGGTGIAPLFFLVKNLIKKSKRITFVIGAKTKSELLFLYSLKQLCKKQTILSTTEDGSYGLNCIVTKPLKKLIDQEKYNMIYTCGPEPMIRKVFDVSETFNTPMEASLERFMRCGIGLCGSCVIGKYRVCRDGPIFNSIQLREIQDEFGFSKLDRYGKTIPI